MTSYNQRGTVCGKSGPEKACKACVTKYGQRFDLTTPDGRFQARQEEQGSPLEREKRRWEKAEAERESVLAKLAEKLDRAQAAVTEYRYEDITQAVRDIERLAKKIKELS